LDRAIAGLAFLEGLPQIAFTAKHSVFSAMLEGLRLTSGQNFEKAAQWQVGVYWVGYPEEKAKAKQYLVKFSGKELELPAQYLQWLRKNRLGLSY